MSKPSITLAFLTLCLAGWVVAPAAVAQTEQVPCAGCKTEHMLIEHVSADFAQVSGLKLMPGNTGNKKAISLFAEGKLDFAYTCKPHQKLVKKFGIDPALAADWVSTTIARDPIVVVLNRAVGVTDLTMDQLKGLFTGRYANWSELGGTDLPIVLAYLDDTVESGAVTVFTETALDDEALSPTAKRLQSPSQLGHFTNATPGAVTFMALNSYDPAFGPVAAIAGVQPDRQEIVAGKYPLGVTYNVVYDRKRGEKAREFLAFLASPEGTALIDQIMVAVPQQESPLP